MARNHSLEANKGKLTDIKNNIDQKKKELSELQEQKQAIWDVRTTLEGTNIDEKAKSEIVDETNSALLDNSNKGKELSSEMNSDFKMMDELKQESQEAISDAETQRSNLQGAKSLLDRFGLGKSMENAISELNESQKSEEDYISMVNDVEHTASAISQALNNLG